MKWQGAVTVVTGASRGIGRAVARAAAARGARVGLVARSATDLDAVLAEIDGADAGAVAVADVAARDEVEEAMAALAGALGPIDVLVNNAGIGAYGAFADTDPDEFERLMRVNYLGTVYATKAVLPGMIERRRGHVVNVASIAGRIGAPFESAYSASKFAVVGLSEALSVEVSPFGIGVSLVNPGPVDTEFFATRGHPYERGFPRPVTAERVAAAVVAAVERDRPEQFVPRTLGPAFGARALLPPLYRWGTRRTFADELRQVAAAAATDKQEGA